MYVKERFPVEMSWRAVQFDWFDITFERMIVTKERNWKKRILFSFFRYTLYIVVAATTNAQCKWVCVLHCDEGHGFVLFFFSFDNSLTIKCLQDIACINFCWWIFIMTKIFSLLNELCFYLHNILVSYCFASFFSFENRKWFL